MGCTAPFPLSRFQGGEWEEEGEMEDCFQLCSCIPLPPASDPASGLSNHSPHLYWCYSFTSPGPAHAQLPTFLKYPPPPSSPSECPLQVTGTTFSVVGERGLTPWNVRDKSPLSAAVRQQDNKDPNILSACTPQDFINTV